MAYNPLSSGFNIKDPYGISPSQRLKTALNKTTMDRRNLGTGYNRQRYDIGQAQKEAVPQIGERFISRGIYDSGLRKKALAQQLAAFDRARSEAATAQNRAILDLALQDLAAQGQFTGERLQRATDASAVRAAKAAEIREAMS